MTTAAALLVLTCLVGLFLGAISATWHRMTAEWPTILADPDEPYDHVAAGDFDWDSDVEEYRRRSEAGATTLAAVLVPFALFVVVLVVAWVGR